MRTTKAFGSVRWLEGDASPDQQPPARATGSTANTCPASSAHQASRRPSVPAARFQRSFTRRRATNSWPALHRPLGAPSSPRQVSHVVLGSMALSTTTTRSFSRQRTESIAVSSRWARSRASRGVHRPQQVPRLMRRGAGCGVAQHSGEVAGPAQPRRPLSVLLRNAVQLFRHQRNHELYRDHEAARNGGRPSQCFSHVFGVLTHVVAPRTRRYRRQGSTTQPGARRTHEPTQRPRWSASLAAESLVHALARRSSS